MMSEQNENFYFWLGADGESYELSEEEFNYQVEKARKRKQDYLNIEIENID